MKLLTPYLILDESQSISGNQEFMINLITNSLLGDNILHTFLQKAIERKFLISMKPCYVYMKYIVINNISNISIKIISIYFILTYF